MKFQRVYMFGGTSGKDDPTDYIVGYKGENGSYIDKRTSAFDSQVWYECEGRWFWTLAEAKEFASKQRGEK